MSTDFETMIPAKAVDPKALEELINNLAATTGQTIEMKPVYVLATPDAGVGIILDQLRDSLRNGETVAARKTAKRPYQRQKPLRQGELGSKSWRREDTNEVDSARAWKKAIAEGKIPLRTRFSNAKGEFIVVLQGDHGLEPVKEPQA